MVGGGAPVQQKDRRDNERTGVEEEDRDLEVVGEKWREEVGEKC